MISRPHLPSASATPRWTARVLVGAVLVLLVPATARASEGLKQPATELEATGRATIYHDDLAGARERAVQAALRRGLEQYAGLRIESSTLISKGELIAREVKAHTHGYVRSFEVLRSERESAELVVRVRLVVADEPVAESFRRLIAATSVVLLVDERNLGESTGGAFLRDQLLDPLAGAELTLPPPEVLQELSTQLPSEFFRAPDSATIREIGLRWLSEMVVVARAETEQLDSATAGIGYEVDASVTRPVVAARGELGVFEARTGEPLVLRSFEDVRGSDASSPDRAGREALDELARRMAEALVQELSEEKVRRGFTLQVVVEGPQGADGAPRVRQVLESTRWVEAVELVEEGEDRSVLRARTAEKPVYVIEELRRALEVEIRGFEAGQNLLTLR